MAPQKAPNRHTRPVVARRDNAARRAWRQLEPPKAKMNVNCTFLKAITGTSYDTHKSNAFPNVDGLADMTGTHIEVRRSHGSDDTATLRFWGDQDRVADAQTKIKTWIDELGGQSSGAANWAKISSDDPQLRARLDQKLLQDELRQAFRQEPPADATFSASAFFPWPINDYPLEDTLGASCEALDAIRMDCQCYIVWDPTKARLKMMGNDGELVREALVRVRGAFCQVAARSVEMQHVLLFKLPTNGNNLLNTRLTNSYIPKLLRDAQNPNKKYVTAIADIECDGIVLESTANQDAADRSKLNMTRQMEVFFQLLERLRYYKGDLKAHFRLGTFLVQQYKNFPDGGWSIEELEAKLKEKGRAMVTQEIGNDQLEQKVLERMLDADSILAPSTTWARTLREDLPTYSAVFVLADPSDESCYRFEIAFKDLGDSFERTSHSWSKLDPGSTVPTTLLNVPLVDLENDSAWTFEMTAAQPILDMSQVPKNLLRLAKGVQLDDERARDHAHPSRFIKFPSGLPIVYYDQKVAWTFNIVGSQYQVEVGRVQRGEMDKFKTPAIVSEPTGYPPQTLCWTLTVGHDDWSRFLGSHTTLPMGGKTDYQINEQIWFPKDFEAVPSSEDGFSSLMEKLGKIEAVVRGEKVLGDPSRAYAPESTSPPDELGGDEDLFY